MARHYQYDAVVVGAGPNGLAAAITLLHSGKSVAVYEAHSKVGGGARSEELTLPGFVHDVCSAVHPLGNAERQLCKCEALRFPAESTKHEAVATKGVC